MPYSFVLTLCSRVKTQTHVVWFPKKTTTYIPIVNPQSGGWGGYSASRPDHYLSGRDAVPRRSLAQEKTVQNSIAKEMEMKTVMAKYGSPRKCLNNTN